MCTGLWSDQRVSQDSLSQHLSHKISQRITTKFGRRFMGYSVEACYYKGNHTGISYYSGTPTETSYIQQSHTDHHFRHFHEYCCYTGNVTDIRYYAGTPTETSCFVGIPIQTRYYSNTHQLLSIPQKQAVILS
jgi:hypothetical protein